MMCVIEIGMGNAAFEDNGPAQELRNIINKLMVALEMSDVSEGLYIKAFDSNGNRVGELEIIK